MQEIIMLGSENEEMKSEHVKAVYAHFGLAVYLSQCLEHSIVNALFCCEFIPNNMNVLPDKNRWNIALDKFKDRQFANTMGAMVKVLKKTVIVPSQLEDVLVKSLNQRNWLVHHYFRERDTAFMSWEGRDKMLVELKGAQDLFLETDKVLQETILPFRIKYGITDEIIERAYQDMIAELKIDL